MLSEVQVENYRSILSPALRLELRPLTILTGPTAAGKSALLEALALVHWLAGSGSAFSDARGPIKVEYHENLWPIVDPARIMRLSLECRPSTEPTLRYTFEAGNAREIQSARWKSGAEPEIDAKSLPPDRLKAFRMSIPPLYHVGLPRGSFRLHKAAGVRITHVGSGGEHTEEVVMELSRPQRRDQMDLLQRWYAMLLVTDIGGRWDSGNLIALEYKDSWFGKYLPIPCASYGQRQALPVLAQLAAAAEGDTVLLEEPETSLHPEAQQRMADIIADAVAHRRQIVLTTHSQDLLLSFQKPLRDGVIADSQIGCYSLTRDPADGGTRAKEDKFAEAKFIIGWPPHLSQAERGLERRADPGAFPEVNQNQEGAGG